MAWYLASTAMRVVPLLFPLAGSVLFWGAMKSIAWVATGFTASKVI
jgi:hypothetical protein